MDWRKAFFAKHVKRSNLGIEIGPSHNPIVTKKDGYNVKIVDHADKKNLVKKYKALQIDTSQIEDVDYVWDGKRTLTDLIGKKGKFDYVIASHLVEHTTDLITFLKDCENLLKPTGKLVLAIPDKRYCFDYFRFPTTTGDLLDAHYTKRIRHTPGKMFDYVSSAALRGGDMGWSEGNTKKLTLLHTVEEAHDRLKEAMNSKTYLDMHNWMFTPASFKLIISDLQNLGITKLSYSDALPTAGLEFFVVLSPSASRIKKSRIKLLQEMTDDMHTMLFADSEYRVQIDTMSTELEIMKDNKQQLENITRELESIKNSKRWKYTSRPAGIINKIRKR
jgi:predicted SAM-dependent methyltransferase